MGRALAAVANPVRWPGRTVLCTFYDYNPPRIQRVFLEENASARQFELNHTPRRCCFWLTAVGHEGVLVRAISLSATASDAGQVLPAAATLGALGVVYGDI